MSRQTNPFQELITAAEKLLAADGVVVRGSVELPEPSADTQREADVIVDGVINGEPVRIALECRDHVSPQDITWIDQLIGKYEDLTADVVIAISRSGFTKPAKEKAAAHNIRTFSLEELATVPPERGSITPAFRFLQRGYNLEGISIELDPQKVDDAKLEPEYRVITSEGKDAGTLKELVQAVIAEHLPARVDQFLAPQAQEIMNEGLRREYPLTVHLNGKGDKCVLPDGSTPTITRIDLHLNVTAEVVHASTKHYGYKGGAVTVARATEASGVELAIVGLQLPGAPNSIRLSIHKGAANKIPG